MDPEMIDAEELDAWLSSYATTDSQPAEPWSRLLAIAGQLTEALPGHLDDSARQRIFSHTLKLAVPPNRHHAWPHVHVGKRAGAVLGGVAALGLSVAIGYAVVQQRHRRVGMVLRGGFSA